jgi:hypothetical protein
MERADAVVVMPVDELANQSPGSGSFRRFTLLVVPVGLTRWDGGRVTLTASVDLATSAGLTPNDVSVSSHTLWPPRSIDGNYPG